MELFSGEKGPLPDPPIHAYPVSSRQKTLRLNDQQKPPFTAVDPPQACTQILSQPQLYPAAQTIHPI